MPGGLDILTNQGFQPTLFAEERWSRPVTRGQRPHDLLDDRCFPGRIEVHAEVMTMGDRLLRRRQVEEITGMTRSSIYRLMDSGDFPRPVRVGPAAVRWKESEITCWLESRAHSEESVPARPTQPRCGLHDRNPRLALLFRLPLRLGGQVVRPQLHQCAAPLEEIGPGVRLFGRIAQEMGKCRL